MLAVILGVVEEMGFTVYDASEEEEAEKPWLQKCFEAWQIAYDTPTDVEPEMPMTVDRLIRLHKDPSCEAQGFIGGSIRFVSFYFSFCF